MIELKYKKSKFQLAQSWAEITVKQWEGIINAQNDQELITSCTIFFEGPDTNFDESFIEQISGYLKWVAKPIDYLEWSLKPEYKIDIKEKTFGQLILLREASAKTTRIREAIEIYFPTIVIDDLMLYDAVTIANDLYKQAEEINKLEERNLKHTPTAEQKRAGIDRFNKYGINNTVDALANGDVLKYKDVYALDYNTVFLKLKRSKDESEYNKNYSKIMSEKK